MTYNGSIAAVGLGAALAAGLGGAFVARGLAPRQEDPRAVVAAALAQESERIAALEERVARAERERTLAERQIAEAMSTALDAKRELDRVRSQTEDLFGLIGSGTPVDLAARGAGAEGGSARAPAAGGQEPLLAAMVGGGGPSVAAESPYGTRSAPDQHDVVVVKQALEQIRREEEQQRNAEREQRRKEQQQRQLANLAQRLGLDAQQTEQLGAIWEEAGRRRREMMEQMRESGFDREQSRAAMTALREEEQKKIQAILTPQQYADLQAIQEEQVGRRGGWDMGGSGAGGFGPGGGALGGGGQGGGRRGVR